MILSLKTFFKDEKKSWQHSEPICGSLSPKDNYARWTELLGRRDLDFIEIYYTLILCSG